MAAKSSMLEGQCYKCFFFVIDRLASDKHSSLLGTYVSNEENEVLWIWQQTNKLECFSPTIFSAKSRIIFKTLFFFITYEWAQWARLFAPGKPFQLSVIKHSILLGPLVSYEEKEVLWI